VHAEIAARPSRTPLAPAPGKAATVLNAVSTSGHPQRPMGAKPKISFAECRGHSSYWSLAAGSFEKSSNRGGVVALRR
jgi:hypothetical protein